MLFISVNAFSIVSIAFSKVTLDWIDQKTVQNFTEIKALMAHVHTGLEKKNDLLSEKFDMLSPPRLML